MEAVLVKQWVRKYKRKRKVILQKVETIRKGAILVGWILNLKSSLERKPMQHNEGEMWDIIEGKKI